MPRIPTFKSDLAKAGIPFQDERGRRIDLHALRTTFGTMLAVDGVSLQASKSLMRQSDVKLTLKAYTDESHLPLQEAIDSLPSFLVPSTAALLSAHAGAVSGQNGSQAVAGGREQLLSQVSPSDATSREKAAGVETNRFPKMAWLFVKVWGHGALDEPPCPQLCYN